MEKDPERIENIKRIAIIGPESTGKSTLAEKLAGHYKTQWVKEYAREYIDNLDSPYQKHDINLIARGQVKSEDLLMQSSNKILICDTNLLVIKIWSEHKYGHCEGWIIDEISKRTYDLHFLTYINLPWADDPQREHPHMRAYFYELYKKELESRHLKFIEVKGDMDNRFITAVSAINALLQ